MCVSVWVCLAPKVRARALPRAPPLPSPPSVLPPQSAPSSPSRRRPSRALAPPLPSPLGESRAAAAGARQALCSSPLPFSLWGGVEGGASRCDCTCVRPGTGSGCGGAGDEEEWGGLGGGCLSGGWQSSAPWRRRRDVPKEGSLMKGWAATSGESCQGLFQGSKGVGGTAGVSSRSTTVQPEGGTSGCKALGRQGRSGGGRPEEVAGPELALCLTQGLVHPPSPQFSL